MMRVVGRRRKLGVAWFSTALLAMLALAGCTLPQDKSPPPQTYVLEVGTFAPPLARRSSGKTLLVAAPRAAPGFDSNRIAYTREPLKLDYYSNNVWSDTPAKMLLPVLVRAFEGTGAFKAVVSPPAPTLANMRVDVDVIRLQQEFMTQPSRVRLTARIKVVEALEPAPSEDAYGAAQAANAAVRKVLGDMIPFTLQYL